MVLHEERFHSLKSDQVIELFATPLLYRLRWCFVTQLHVFYNSSKAKMAPAPRRLCNKRRSSVGLQEL